MCAGARFHVALQVLRLQESPRFPLRPAYNRAKIGHQFTYDVVRMLKLLRCP
jgi:hypothetical protein